MTLTAVLLVGGLSQRMGMDKAEVLLDGGTLWKRQLGLLRELKPEAIWISARARPHWCPQQLHVVEDQPPSCGPISGIAASLASLQTTHLLALAVDMPQMTGTHLKRLWALAKPGCGVIPLNGYCLEPLCAIYPIEAGKILAEALEAGELSLQQLARDLIRKKYLRTYYLNREERSHYLNVNTPSDLPET